MAYETRALIWQGFFALAMFLSTFVSYLLPILIFTKRNRRLEEIDNNIEDIGNVAYWGDGVANGNITEEKRNQLKRWLSYCNCVSAGVFLGVCFLNLIPYVEKEFAQLIQDFGGLKNLIGTFPLGLFSVVAGLFMVLILEALLSNCFTGHDSHETSVLYLDEDLNESPHDSNEQEGLLPSGEHSSADLESSHSIAPKLKPTNENHNGGHNSHSKGNHHHQPSHESDRNHQQHHGHQHIDPQMFFSDNSNSMFSFFILMFATSIHSLFEGLALGLQTNVTNAIHLFIGIILHECLVALALGLNAIRLQQERIQLRKQLKFAFVFSMTIPMGNILGILLGYTPGHFGRFISAIFQGFAAGTFIHVTFIELIPSELLSPDCDSDYHATNLDNRTAVNSNSTEDTLQSSSSSISLPELSKPASNVRLKKILLLLVGFLIMSIFPFISSD